MNHEADSTVAGGSGEGSLEIERPTSREMEILVLLADGLSNLEIARRLHVSDETVKTHIRHLLMKLKAKNRTNAITHAFRAGLLT